jgi:3-hydroxyacyl-[acyl-carrier-protein] dehydratase
MLANKLYTAGSIDISGSMDKISAEVRLNQEHPIFGGHFPDNPILPGVCTLQIIQELLEVTQGKKFMMSRASSIKYLGFVNPVLTPVLTVILDLKNTESGSIGCNATVATENGVACIFKGEFIAFPVSSSRMQQ